MKTPHHFYIFLVIALLFLFYGFNQSVQAGTEPNVSGWAWASNIGWISFNCTNQGSCDVSDYVVHINPISGIPISIRY